MKTHCSTNLIVTPAKAGVQGIHILSEALDSRFRGTDEVGCPGTDK
jgi:hypothetical protein